MTKKKFDASIPRKMFWSNEIPNSKLCPNCNAKLEREYHTYLIATRKEGNYETFITGNDGGYFCPNCDIVVLDWDKFARLVSIFSKFSKSVEFTVLGIVDVNAIPEDKRSIPIGGDDNPIPLVEFTNLSKERPKNKGGKRSRRRHRR